MNEVIDAREIFAGRAGVPVKFPSFSPNLRHLRDLCSGICRSCTSIRPVKDFRGGPPADLVEELAAALRRSVHHVGEDVVVQVGRSGWLVVFDAADGDSTFTYSFTIHEKWIVREKPVPPVA